jgi:hypothetical protein
VRIIHDNLRHSGDIDAIARQYNRQCHPTIHARLDGSQPGRDQLGSDEGRVTHRKLQLALGLLRQCSVLYYGGDRSAVGYHLEDIELKFAFTGEARLHLAPHSNCRLADLPVRRIHYGQHLCVDLTLPYGKVLHDYLVETK